MLKSIALRTVASVLFAFIVLDALMWSMHHQPHNVPEYPSVGIIAHTRPLVWTPADAKRFSNCRDAAKIKRFASELVVIGPNQNHTFRETFDAAWKINHDGVSGNNIWVIGKCF
jgi:hypothetical protein